MKAIRVPEYDQYAKYVKKNKGDRAFETFHIDVNRELPEGAEQFYVEDF